MDPLMLSIYYGFHLLTIATQVVIAVALVSIAVTLHKNSKKENK